MSVDITLLLDYQGINNGDGAPPRQCDLFSCRVMLQVGAASASRLVTVNPEATELCDISLIISKICFFHFY